MTRLVSMMTWICITVKTKNKKRRLGFAQVKTRIGKERDVGAFVTCELGYLLFCPLSIYIWLKCKIDFITFYKFYFRFLTLFLLISVL